MADENDDPGLVSSIIDEDFAAFEEELLFDSRYDLPHSFPVFLFWAATWYKNVFSLQYW